MNISVWATYNIYDEDTASCFEVGDIISLITYIDEDYEEITVKNAEISNINEEMLTIELEDESEVEICIDNIIKLER